AWLRSQTRERLLLDLLTGALLVGAGVALAAAMGRTALVVGLCVAVASLAIGSWIGANSPTESWFGAMVAHGPRREDRVALTFDDGPNATATLAIRDILHSRGIEATFFEVGKAVDARPDIARGVLADGDLLANHSYHHDSVRWLDPRYLELGRTERSFARQLGVCPAFFRPPHGQHTP